MAVDITQLTTNIQALLKQNLSDNYAAAVASVESDTNMPALDPESFDPIAAIYTPAIILAVQTILNDGEVAVTVTDVTTGSGSAPGTGTIS